MTLLMAIILLALPLMMPFLDNEGVEYVVGPNDEDINDEKIFDDNDCLSLAIEPLQNRFLENIGVENENEGREVEVVDMENEGMDSENEVLDNDFLPPK